MKLIADSAFFQGTMATLAAFLIASASPTSAQPQDREVETGGVRIEQQEAPDNLRPLSATEIAEAVRALQADERIRALLDGRVRTVRVERHEEDKNARAADRRAAVVLYNYETNETTSAVVTIGPRPRVEQLTITTGQPPMLSSEELDEAQRLALADPTVQRELREAGLNVPPRRDELYITHLLIETEAPPECRSNRCVALFFNTRDAVLAIETIVDLTSREVFVR